MVGAGVEGTEVVGAGAACRAGDGLGGGPGPAVGAVVTGPAGALDA